MAQAGKKRKREQVAGAPHRKHPEHTHPSGWDRLRGRTQHAICLLFLLIVALSFFASIIFSDKALFASDVVSWRAMAEYMVQYERETGNDALWAPNAFAGMPGYTVDYDPQVPQLDDFPSFLRRFMWPASHFIFLLFGVYFLIAYLTRSKLSGVLSALAYGLTTYTIVVFVAGHNTKFIAFSYAPWLLLAFAYAIQRPRLLGALLFAAALALNLRAGHVQITYYLAFLLGIWWIVELVGAFRHGRMAAFGRSTAWLALGTVLGVLMVAQPYLVLSEYRDFSTRGGGAVEGGGAGLGWEYAMTWSQGIAELTTLLIAHAFGGSAPLYWGPKPFTAGPHYVGGIVLVLAVVALWRVRRNAVYGLGIAAFVLTLFALGSSAPFINRPMYEFFPLFSAFRAPETWLSAVALALAVLAGLGLAYLAFHGESHVDEDRRAKSLYVTTGAVAGFVLLLLATGGLYLDFEREGEMEQVQQYVASQYQLPVTDPQVAAASRTIYEEQLATPRVEAFRSDAFRTLIFLALLALAFFLYQRRIIPSWAMQAAVALLVLIDLWGVDRRYFNSEALVEAETLESQIPTYDFDQYVIDRQEEAGGAGHFRVLSLERQDATTNARPSYYFESLGGYSAAKLRLFQDFLDHVLFDSTTGLPNPKALDLLNTRYVLAPGTLPGMNVVHQSQTGVHVLENPDAAPRAFFVGETEVVESSEAMFARLRSDAFDARRTALLSEPADIQTSPLDSSNVATVQLESYSPHEIVWQVETDAPRLLVASEIYYPAGWKAYIGEQEAPIHRVDYLLRGVEVPQGAHTVTMRFDPPTQATAFWISALSTLAVYGGILLLVGLAWRRRRERTNAPEQTSTVPHT